MRSSQTKVLSPTRTRSLQKQLPKLEKKRDTRPTLSWPEALRQIRAWLEPYLMLKRYWQAWSREPPPRQLQQLLDWLFEGKPIYLYTR